LETSKSDIEIIEEILSGGKSAFKLLYSRHSRNHFLTCIRYVKNRADAEDMLQESYIKIFRDLRQFNAEKANFRTWSNKVVINTCLMKLRKKNILVDYESFVEHGKNVKIQASAIDNLSLQELTNLILKLPKGYRTVFNLFVIDGFSHKEIAEKLDITINTSKTQLMKAKKNLQIYLNQSVDFDNLNYANR